MFTPTMFTSHMFASDIFTPHITVACVVQAAGQFLLVEETINGRALWNQPAGHLEANETLPAAAERELWEETGICAAVQALLQIHQWTAPDHTPFLRFLFVIDLAEQTACCPQDSDIDRCLWLPAQQIRRADNLRSPLVADSIRCYQSGQRYPLTLLNAFSG